MKKILIITLTFLTSFGILTDDHSYRTVTGEVLQCNLKDGKDVNDVIKMVKKDWYDLEYPAPYEGWVLTPTLFAASDGGYDLAWAGFTYNNTDLGTTLDWFYENGTKVFSKWQNLVDCASWSHWDIFEARRPKDSAIIAENDGVIEFGKEVRGKQKISIVSSNGDTSNYLIPKGKHVNFNQGEKIKKGEYLLDGSPAPHDILRILGVEKLTEYFVSEVQEVYRLQGVVINDKHIETIVRQMLKRVEIKDPGDSEFLTGEVIDLLQINAINDQLRNEKKKPATFERVLLGITKASLQTNSFISAASFQETTRVLTDASIKGKTDTLEGLKENVIVGRLVPAGTGLTKIEWDKQAREQDKARLEELKKQELESAPAAPDQTA